VKDQIGMGYYARQQHEHLLIAKCGNLPVPEPQNRPESVVYAPRGEHSAKPEQFYDLIERMYPGLSYVELFARSARPGWTAWGNQC
jgi:N6-adenosine-specific RNA methylase IME4